MKKFLTHLLLWLSLVVMVPSVVAALISFSIVAPDASLEVAVNAAINGFIETARTTIFFGWYPALAILVCGTLR